MQTKFYYKIIPNDMIRKYVFKPQHFFKDLCDAMFGYPSD